ncbi:hypothetical protein NPIL_361061 [Nephila pilipes]|uniref:Uncharacterized protein n=1 Tax=Nephila pilipes TaxID=299642 RepID=A0A8X6TPB9_NEPPI|nr:hypothetical protein NPIL_361061 [Nephila pilipes]
MCLNECFISFFYVPRLFVTAVDGLPGPVSEHRLSLSLKSSPEKRNPDFFDCFEAFLLWSVAPRGVFVLFPAVLLCFASSLSSASAGFFSAFLNFPWIVFYKNFEDSVLSVFKFSS